MNVNIKNGVHLLSWNSIHRYKLNSHMTSIYSSLSETIPAKKRKGVAFFCTKGNILSNNNLKSPNSKDAEAFQSILNDPNGSIITGKPSDLEKYNIDWLRKHVGKSKIVLKPQTTEEVSSILSYCNEHHIGVVPQAGNTGLVGGSVPIFDEVIVSLEAMNKTISFDEINGILVCESGCVLQNLHDYVASKKHLIPIDLGSKGTCMIGGNVSTNAGGQYFYRFGSLHANVLGLEIVLANGTVLDLMNTNRKDNTGYDLKHLFIGAEGTLGIVTKVVLSCPRLPKSRNVALIGCNSFEAVQKALSLAKEELGETLAAFELMDGDILRLIEETVPGKLPECFVDGSRSGACSVLNLSNISPFCLLVETLGSNEEHDSLKMDRFLELGLEHDIFQDGTLAQDGKQIQEFWSLRESCNPVTASNGYVYKYDISIPITDFSDIVMDMKKHLLDRTDVICVSWGHVIDGNLHINIISPGKFDVDEDILNLIEPYIFENTICRGGSISAEHGLGCTKNNYLTLVKSEECVKKMYSIKSMFDPKGIMNPFKYLPNK